MIGNLTENVRSQIQFFTLDKLVRDTDYSINN